jgi:hypothetical protein
MLINEAYDEPLFHLLINGFQASDYRGFFILD